jgi:ABC-type dipeptide/oligopeptide/nickel transport system permease subunit
MRLWRKRLAMIGLAVVLVIYGMGITAHWTAPYSYREQNLERGLEGPSTDHWLGTDRLGRDMFSRVMFSARTTVLITFTVIITGGLVIGPTLGLIAGYRGGWIDGIIGRVGDIFIALPGLPMLILVNAALAPRVIEWTRSLENNTPLSGLVDNGVPSYFTVFAALSLFFWVGSMRIIRAQTLQLRERDFVQAAQAMGAGSGHVIWRHLLPNVSFLLILGASTALGAVAGSELFLTWFGVGIQPPAPSFGAMIFEAGSVRTFQAQPHLLLVPSFFVVSLLFAFALLGDALNDAIRDR